MAATVHQAALMANSREGGRPRLGVFSACADLIQRPPRRGVRGHRPEDLVLLTQQVEIADRLAAIGNHHAASTTTRPRLCTGHQSVRASAADNAAVNPARSASIRSSAAPTCDTTPVPSAATRRSLDHAVNCTSEVHPW
jgi:hypothetical protein